MKTSFTLRFLKKHKPFFNWEHRTLELTDRFSGSQNDYIKAIGNLFRQKNIIVERSQDDTH
ncbi:MAG: hypothetical protein CSA81_12075 [Acidobacteria bacterium]|nr:MAG: hypothetical protein CSA81_12075 [Acidobacteriota bacterium]